MIHVPSEPPDLDDEQLVRLLDAHHARALPVLSLGAVVAGGLGLLLWQRSGNPLLLGWIVLVQLALAARAVCALIYQRGGRERWSPRVWHLMTLATVTAGGAAWGALAWAWAHSSDEMVRLAITLALTGVSAGMAVVVHSAPGVVQSFGLAALLPLAFAMARDPAPLSAVPASLLVLFAVVVNILGPASLGRNLRRLFLNMRTLDDALARAADAEDMAHVGHIEWDHDRRTARLSSQARALFGLEGHEFKSSAVLWSRVPQPERDRVFALSRDAAGRGLAELRFETQLDGRGRLHDLQVVQRFEYHSTAHHPRSRLRRTLTTFADITDLKDAQRNLHRLAFRDPLTGLANRSLFAERLAQEIAVSVRDGTDAAVAMLDLDHFKKVNDSFGHNAGDQLLCEAAERLRAAVRDGDMVARLGGDEFAVIFPQAPSDQDLALRAQQIIARLSEPFVVEETQVFISASVGLARCPRDSRDPDGVMRCADVALFEAKGRGRAGHYFFDQGLSERASERIALETDLRHAVDRGELALHYQTKVDIANGQPVGAEALLRWHHPTRGLVPPDRFIGIAEDTGLILPIGTWVLRTACLAALEWNRAALANAPEGGAPTGLLKIAVNLSARQFLNQDIVAVAATVLAETGCPSACIELEITESLLFDDRAGVLDALRGLRGLGFTIAIDDFGTGYSALGYLTRFPITTLKIDRSFIHSMTEDSDHLGLVNAIISMGKVLRLDLVAEGIETLAQARLLRSMGCHLGQGWLYGKPMPHEAFDQALGLARPAAGHDTDTATLAAS